MAICSPELEFCDFFQYFSMIYRSDTSIFKTPTVYNNNQSDRFNFLHRAVHAPLEEVDGSSVNLDQLLQVLPGNHLSFGLVSLIRICDSHTWFEMMYNDIESYVAKSLELLQEERQAEIDETRSLQENVSARELEKQGVCLSRMTVKNQHTGLYGRRVAEFEAYPIGRSMPSHYLTPGDIVGVKESTGSMEQIASGVVSKFSVNSISIAFDSEALELNDVTYTLVKLANDITYKRLRRGLEKLNKYRSGPALGMMDVMFNSRAPSSPTTLAKEIIYQNEGLNENQRKSVEFALCAPEVAIIHGPPGTGKTTTVVEIIQQALKQKLKILACAPSNIAVDNLLERLTMRKVKVVRLGHPARLLPSIQQHSLDAILSSSHMTQLVHDVRKDIDMTLSKMKKRANKGEKQHLREDLKHYRKELRERENAATKDILSRAEVVMATLTSATDDGPLRHLPDGHFDLVVIDECSQCTEAACWLALLHGKRCVLAGDHQQLPPTIISSKAAKDGLEVTLMERLLEMYGDTIMNMLTVQYRMNHKIMDWSSKALYKGKLVAHDSVSKHLLRDLPDMEDNEDTCTPLLLIDTVGCHMYELEASEEASKANTGEVDLVQVHVERLIASGLKPQDIAVISPYNLQVELLRLRLSQRYHKLEIKSVDGFQGREKEAVIISLVRSNDKGEVGFLAEKRRINVAITRARRHLALICDSETVEHDEFLASLVEYMNEHGDIRTPYHYTEEIDCLENTGVPSHIKIKPKADNKTEKRPTKTRPAGKQKPHGTQTESKPPTKSPEEEEQRIKELKAKMLEFIENKECDSYSFPSSLNSHDRLLVHQIAEELKLNHVSQGEEKKRFIVISKPNVKEVEPRQDNIEAKQVCVEVTQDNVEAAEENDRDSDDSNIKDGIDNIDERMCESGGTVNIIEKQAQNVKATRTVNIAQNGKQIENVKGFDQTCAKMETESEPIKICECCTKEIPQMNYELHTIHCKVKSQAIDLKAKASILMETTQSLSGAKPKSKPKSAKSKQKQPMKKPKKNDLASQMADADDDDIDALVALVTKSDNVCTFKKCKVGLSVLGQHCGLCSKRYCIEHSIPEVHGCGSAAKIRARQLISREGVLYMGSGVPDKSIDPSKRAHLQRKMDKKRSEMTDKRKIKKSEK